MQQLNKKKILDVSCGSKMFWFDKNYDAAIYGDIRRENHTLCDNRSLSISPDVIFDFKALPFKSESFNLVIFDPPHLEKLGSSSWMAKKYGILKKTWREDIRQGFIESFRVLKTNNILIFKWNETDIKTSEILSLTEYQPLIGHISGKRSNTHWITFLK